MDLLPTVRLAPFTSKRVRQKESREASRWTPGSESLIGFYRRLQAFLSRHHFAAPPSSRPTINPLWFFSWAILYDLATIILKLSQIRGEDRWQKDMKLAVLGTWPVPPGDRRLIFCRAILSALVWDRCLIRTRIMFQLCECLAFVSREVHVGDGQEGWWA